MRSTKVLSIVWTSVSLLCIAGCSSAGQSTPSETPKSLQQILCEPASEAVAVVDELAQSTTDGVVEFPRIELLKSALAARGLSGDNLGVGGTSESTILSSFKNTFEECLSPAGIVLLDNSWRKRLAAELNSAY